MINERTVYFPTLEKDVFVSSKVVPNRKAVVNAQTGTVLGIVGSGYQVVDNKQLASHFQEITKKLGIEIDLQEGTLIRGGAKTIMRFRMPQERITVTKGDVVELNGYLVNGFDGFSSAKLVMGFFRLICKNGAVVGRKDIDIHYRHVGEVNEKLLELFNDYLIEKTEAAKQFIGKLVESKVLDFMKAEEIIAEHKFMPEKYRDMVLAEWEKKKSKSMWELYNNFTFVVTHKMEVNQENKLNQLKQLYSVNRQLIERR